MKTTYIIIALFLSLCLQQSLAQTQFLSQEAYHNKISFSSGLEPAFIYNLRYDRLSSLPFTSLRSSYFVKAEATFFRTLSEHSEWSLGTQLLLWEKGNFHLLYETSVANGRLEAKTYSAKKWQWNNSLEAGFFGKKTAISAFAGYSQNLALQLASSDFYRESIYDAAAAGWFKGVGGYAEFGIKGHMLIRERLNIQLQLKSAVTSGGYPLNMLPAQASVGLGFFF